MSFTVLAFPRTTYDNDTIHEDLTHQIDISTNKYGINEYIVTGLNSEPFVMTLHDLSKKGYYIKSRNEDGVLLLENIDPYIEDMPSPRLRLDINSLQKRPNKGF